MFGGSGALKPDGDLILCILTYHHVSLYQSADVMMFMVFAHVVHDISCKCVNTFLPHLHGDQTQAIYTSVPWQDK